MTLARTALRLQAVLALLADPVLDELCRGRIYDSRIGDFDEREPVPTIVLSTDEDDAKAWSKNDGGPPFNHVCDLVLEIAMMVRRSFNDPALGDVEGIGPPETDSQLEAYLDVLEERAVTVLGVGDTAEARLLQEAVTRRITRARSVRLATDQGVRYATRFLTLTVELKGDDGDPEALDDEAPDDAYAVLPEPLRSVARAMPTGFSGRGTCDRIARMLALLPPDPGAAPLFAGVDLVIAPQTLSAAVTPSRDADLGAGRVITAATDFPEP